MTLKEKIQGIVVVFGKKLNIDQVEDLLEFTSKATHTAAIYSINEEKVIFNTKSKKRH